MDIKTKGMLISALLIFLCSTVFFTKASPVLALSEKWIDEKELGQMCINQIAPAVKIAANNDDLDGTAGNNGLTVEYKEERKKGNDEKADKNEKETAIKVTGDPLVIIYHTHSSESYMPYKESNYHRAEEEGTVRDVGDVLEAELKKKGINVIHDKTVHDRPSYNESYSRSLNTIQSLVKKYPTAVYIIDLHRDAAAASATEGKYIKIDGERVATFSLVVGRANENYVELHDFAKKVSSTAENMFDGFGGGLIEKDYNYNEFVSNKALLLEVGNNKNTIEEARACGRYFADVLANIIKDEQ